MQRVALTGGIATGKSYVLDQFRRRGVACLDADQLAHGVMSAGTEATHAIVSRFGPEVLDKDGSVNRRALGPIVFADATARRDLESIVHPAVRRAIEAGLRAFEHLGNVAFTVVDIPLLFEVHREKEFDRVIVAVCPSPTQIARLMERGLSRADAELRLAAQIPIAEKVGKADFVIRTDGTFAETDAQIEHVLEALQTSTSSTS